MRGSVTKHKDIGWRLQVYLGRDAATGKERRRSRVVPAPQTKQGRKLAELELAKWLVELDPSNLTPSRSMTVAQLFERWLALRSPDWSPKTLLETRRMVDRKILPALGDEVLSTLTGARIDGFLAALRARGGRHGQPLNPATVKRIHGVLKAALSQAVKWGELDRNPADSSTAPRVDAAEVQPPSAEAVGLALQAESDVMWSAFLRLAATSGARRSQLLGLRWSDVDLQSGTITWRAGVVEGPEGPALKGTKSGAVWTVSIDHGTIDALRSHSPSPSPAEAFVFSSSGDGSHPLPPRAVTNWWNRLRRRVPELRSVRFHDLRHFAASQLLAAGVDVRTVAGRLGHSNPAVTLEVYGHFMPAADRNAAAALGDIVSSATLPTGA